MIMWFKRLVVALERIANIMAQIDADKLVTAISTFAADFGTFTTDFAAFLKTIPVTDPTVQAKIDSAVASLGDFDTQVKALDAQVNPPAGGTTQQP